jgi:lysophospholipid acyltransferase (LPLAT)-like uncharacterized protein
VRRLWRRLKIRIIPPIAYFIVRAVGATLRIKTEGYERYSDLQTGAIFAGWHGRTFIPAVFFRNKGVWTIISQSRDGQMQNWIFTKLGFKTIRGSTGRGGVKAAAESIRVLKQGATMAFTPDGPRGPSGVVQGGIMLMAKKSGAALVPVGVSARWRVRMPTWDRYVAPLPFSKCVMVFGDAIFVSKDASDEEVESARQSLERAITELQKKADESHGHKSTGRL